jgi:hypothetical protein
MASVTDISTCLLFSNVRISREGNVHSLEINGARPEQSGELACTAKNSAGSKRQNAQLAVKEVGLGPTFVRNLQVSSNNQSFYCIFNSFFINI